MSEILTRSLLLLWFVNDISKPCFNMFHRQLRFRYIVLAVFKSRLTSFDLPIIGMLHAGIAADQLVIEISKQVFSSAG